MRVLLWRWDYRWRAVIGVVGWVLKTAIINCVLVIVFGALVGMMAYAIGYQTAERETSKVFTSKFTHLNPCAIDHQTKQRIVSGSVDTVYGGDYFGDILYTSPAGTEETLPDLNYFPPPFHFRAKSATFGPVTIKPQEGTIDGQPSLTIKQGECVEIHARKDHYEAYKCDEPTFESITRKDLDLGGSTTSAKPPVWK